MEVSCPLMHTFCSRIQLCQYAATACWAAALILGASLSLLCLRLSLLRSLLSMPECLGCLSPASSFSGCPASPEHITKCVSNCYDLVEADQLRAAAPLASMRQHSVSTLPVDRLIRK